MVLCAVQSSPCSACLCRRREIVLPASEKWLGIAVLWCVVRVLSRVAHWGCLLGEFYTGSARRVSCGESFVPEVVLCAVQSSPCSACWWIERYKVLPASEKWLGIAVLWCVGRVLSRSSGETARSEGVRGLRGMYLRCRRAAARSEGGARPAGPGRASRRRAERSSRRGRRAGGQASHRTEIWRGARSCSRDRLLLGPVLLSSHPQLVLL